MDKIPPAKKYDLSESTVEYDVAALTLAPSKLYIEDEAYLWRTLTIGCKTKEGERKPPNAKSSPTYFVF